MPKYKGKIAVTFIHELEVDAKNQEEAKKEIEQVITQTQWVRLSFGRIDRILLEEVEEVK